MIKLSFVNFYMKGPGKPVFWNPVCLQTSWVCPYVWLILKPYSMFTKRSLSILKVSLLVLLVGILLSPSPWYATRFHSGSSGDFMMTRTCSDVGPSYSSWSAVAPFNQEACVLPFWGISLCDFLDNFLSLSFASNCLPLCSLLSRMVLPSDYSTDFVSALCVFLNSNCSSCFLFFNPPLKPFRSYGIVDATASFISLRTLEIVVFFCFFEVFQLSLDFLWVPFFVSVFHVRSLNQMSGEGLQSTLLPGTGESTLGALCAWAELVSRRASLNSRQVGMQLLRWKACKHQYSRFSAEPKTSPRKTWFISCLEL